MNKVKFSQGQEIIKVNNLEAQMVRKIIAGLKFRRIKRELDSKIVAKTDTEELKTNFKQFMREVLESFELIDSIETKKLIKPFHAITEGLWMNVIAQNIKILIFGDLLSVDTFESDPKKQKIYFPTKECRS